jgi:hypothetical protein
LSRARAQADALKFVQQRSSASSQQGIVFDSGAGKGFSERKATTGKKGLKRAPSKSRLGLSRGHKMDKPTEDWKISGERERRAAEIIVNCSLLGLWEEARSVYDFAAAEGVWGSASFSSLSLAQIQIEALTLLGNLKISAAAVGGSSDK